jgi:hypothetical protein
MCGHSFYPSKLRCWGGKNGRVGFSLLVHTIGKKCSRREEKPGKSIVWLRPLKFCITWTRVRMG